MTTWIILHNMIIGYEEDLVVPIEVNKMLSIEVEMTMDEDNNF